MFGISHSSVKTLAGIAVLMAAVACSSSSNDSTPTAVTANVSGMATAAGGGALDEYVTLEFTPVGGGAPTVVQTDGTATYSVDLTPGMYDVVAARPGYEDFMLAGVNVAAGGATGRNFSLAPLPANTYIGSASCGVCHDSLYQTFRQTGHPFKLNKVNGAAPVYPFTSLAGVEKRIFDDDTAAGDTMPGTDNTLGTPLSWDDITYVIGGFNWKARFIDANGFIVTGSKVQYNYKTDEMVAYHDNETDKPFNCGNCHTTGWQHFDATVNNARQDGLPGMDGTFAEQGVGCEACHGAGSEHAQTGHRQNITKFASPRTDADYHDGTFAYGTAMDCGDCHTRDGERDYPTFKSGLDNARIAAGKGTLPVGGRISVSKGLVKHHEQFDETLGIDPDTLESVRNPAFNAVHGNCVICHDPHKAAVQRGKPGVTEVGVDDTNANCLRCHESRLYDPANNLRPIGSMKDLNCVDCHMPKTAKSATARTQPNGVLEGDVASHVFSINIEGPQFSADGKFSYPYLSMDFACRNCHGDEAFDIATAPAGFNYHPDN